MSCRQLLDTALGDDQARHFTSAPFAGLGGSGQNLVAEIEVLYFPSSSSERSATA